MSELVRDLAAGMTGPRRERPFRHLVHGEGSLLSHETAAALAADFPAPLLRQSHRPAGSDKTYYVRTVALHDDRDPAAGGAVLPESWAWLTDSVIRPDYRDAMADLLSLPEPVAALEVRLSEYPAGGWMSRHTDRPDKLFSQNIYLCPRWNPEWGGGLALYGSADALAASFLITPGLGNSVAFVRSDASWHEVMPVSTDARMPRRAVLIHGYRRAAHAN